MKNIFLLLFVSFSVVATAQCGEQVSVAKTMDWGAMTDSTRFKPVFAAGEPDEYLFTILHADGTQVFTTEIPAQGWNGLQNNRRGKCMEGTFTWTLRCKWNESNVKLDCSGSVTCTNSVAVQVNGLDTLHCRPSIFVPAHFTPNGDGMNDEFKPVFGCLPYSYECTIYNRWGQVVFHTTKPEEGWRATQGEHGSGVSMDTYFWRINCAFYAGQEQRKMEGNVMVVR